MNFIKINLLLTLLILVQLSFGQMKDGDTLVVHAISWEDPSPEGWGASYKETVNFPKNQGPWAKIIMVQSLKCDSATKADKYPCGEWDYIWNTFLHVPLGDTIEVFSIGSFVTPYGKRLWLGGEKGWQWTYDVTDYAPLFKGEMEIVTGNNQELLDLKFIFIKGDPIRNVVSVENIYPYDNYKYGQLADDSVLQKRKIVLSDQAEGFRLKAVISGHGHAGPRNCCEWDSKTHSYYINDWDHFRWNVWKDCGNNPIYPQGGTWPFDRAGWCPGTKVDEYEFELTPLVKPGDTIDLDYGIEYYKDNGERDGEFRMSHQLITYGPANFKNDACLLDIIAPSTKDKYGRNNPVCSNPRILIQNTGSNTLKSVLVAYGMKDGPKIIYLWRGKLEFLEVEEVWLPTPSWEDSRNMQKFWVSLGDPMGMADDNYQNNSLTSIMELPKNFPNEFILQIKTNNLGRAAENSYTIANDAGTVFYSEDNFTDSTEYNLPIKLEDGCYQFRFTDDREDGISVHWWNRNSDPEQVGINGSVSILTKEGEELHVFKHDFGNELLLNFLVEGF